LSTFLFPPSALVNRVLPKSKIYEHGKPSRAVRDGFVAQINQIVWQYKLAPETINLPARPNVPEIEIFSIELKTADVSEDVLRCIDKAIPLPIFHILSFENRTKTVAAYKRPSDADGNRWVVVAYFESPWMPVSAHVKNARAPQPAPLPVALDMASLYEQMMRRLMPHPARAGETLKDHVERLSQLRGKQNEYAKLEARLRQEKQFNRKVEKNSQLRTLKSEIESLAW
jgi:Domain of unknown function (DUF4391)